MTYFQNPIPQLASQAATQMPGQDQTTQMPVLRIAPSAPVQVTPIRSAAGGAGSSQLGQSVLGKQLAAYLQQKYGATGAASAIDNLGTLGDEPLVNAILAGGGNSALSNIDSLGTLGDESLISSMGFGA